jgi:hypothetical protein
MNPEEFEGVDRGCQRYCCRQQKEEMAVVRHSSRSEKRDFTLARRRCNKRIDSFLEFRGDQIFSVFGAVVWCRAYGARTILGSTSQPCRTGLTSDSRPYGPGETERSHTQSRFGAAPTALGRSWVTDVPAPCRPGLFSRCPFGTRRWCRVRQGAPKK